MSDKERLTKLSSRDKSDKRQRSRTPTGRYDEHTSNSYGKSGGSSRMRSKEDGKRDRPLHHRHRSEGRYSPEPSSSSFNEQRRHGRSRSRSPRRSEYTSKRKEHRDHSSSRSASDDERKSKPKRKDKHRHKHRDRSPSSKKHKHRKRDKQEKTNAVTSQWGKYGVINENDIYSKEEEFKTWLVEECKVNPEILSKDQTKKYFARYMEDYNTATLPHEKFYNMKKYESRMDLLRNGELAPQGDEDTYDFNADYRAHSSALKRSTTQSESYLTKEQLQELRQVERERVELIKRKQLGLEISGTLGVRMDGGSIEELLEM